MSEYQYYEFLALDKPLTDEQRAELRKLSSRAGRRVPRVTAWAESAQAGEPRTAKQHPAGKTGRNQPCPCGSGKKFKKCCGALAQS